MFDRLRYFFKKFLATPVDVKVLAFVNSILYALLITGVFFYFGIIANFMLWLRIIFTIIWFTLWSLYFINDTSFPGHTMYRKHVETQLETQKILDPFFESHRPMWFKDLDSRYGEYFRGNYLLAYFFIGWVYPTMPNMTPQLLILYFSYSIICLFAIIFLIFNDFFSLFYYGFYHNELKIKNSPISWASFRNFCYGSVTGGLRRCLVGVTLVGSAVYTADLYYGHIYPGSVTPLQHVGRIAEKHELLSVEMGLKEETKFKKLLDACVNDLEKKVDFMEKNETLVNYDNISNSKIELNRLRENDALLCKRTSNIDLERTETLNLLEKRLNNLSSGKAPTNE